MEKERLLVCARCSGGYPTSEPRWRCVCGGYLRLKQDGAAFPARDLGRRPATVWRYREALGIEDERNIVTMGEGFTPLVGFETAGAAEGCRLLLKLDYLCPTGSYKDRGSTVMISKLKEWGVTAIIEDSSGNAGASLAAYAAAAGIRADIYVPASISPGKAAQIVIHGANLVQVPGSREATAAAALKAADKTFYASHNWIPYFAVGLKTAAYEIAEQLDWEAPDWVVAPVGGGSLLIGLYLGFQHLWQSGVISRIPRLAGVQASGCAPVYNAWRAGRAEVLPVEKGDTVAEGICIANPVRGNDVLEAIRGSQGVMCTVTDEAIWQAVETLGRRGIYVEPTGAVSASAIDALCRQDVIRPGARVVAVLTGSGLKATDKIVDHFLAAPAHA